MRPRPACDYTWVRPPSAGTATTLMAIGPDGVRRIEASALVIAAGSRPLGRAELGLTGPRPAGILPATVACHLSETGLLIGRRPAVIGGGDWAARALERLLHAGADTIEVIAPDGVLRPLPESAQITLRSSAAPAWRWRAPTASLRSIDGGERVDCDAVVLAHGLAPLRNVDGAVWDGPRTVYAQPLRGSRHDVDGAIAAGRPRRRRGAGADRMRVRSPIGDLPFAVTAVRVRTAASW